MRHQRQAFTLIELPAVRQRKRAAFRGFTLIELLVVISIIALLVAILLPALASARQAALIVQCQSNFKHVDVGVHSYSTDHKGFWPDAGVGVGSYWPDMSRIGSEGAASDDNKPWNHGLLIYNAYVPFEIFICPSRNAGAFYETDLSRAGDYVPDPVGYPNYRTSYRGFQNRIDNKRLWNRTSLLYRGVRYGKDGIADSVAPAWGPRLTYWDRYLYHEEIRPSGAPGTLSYLSDDFSWIGSYVVNASQLDPQGQYYHDQRGYTVAYTDGHNEFVGDSQRQIINYGFDSFGKTQHAYRLTYVAEDIWRAFDGAGNVVYKTYTLK